jgi:hypothetical protein
MNRPRMLVVVVPVSKPTPSDACAVQLRVFLVQRRSRTPTKNRACRLSEVIATSALSCLVDEVSDEQLVVAPETFLRKMSRAHLQSSL